MAHVGINGKVHHLGLFDDEVQAWMEREKFQALFMGETSLSKLAWFKHRKKLIQLDAYLGLGLYEEGLRYGTTDEWRLAKMQEHGLDVSKALPKGKREVKLAFEGNWWESEKGRIADSIRGNMTKEDLALEELNKVWNKQQTPQAKRLARVKMLEEEELLRHEAIMRALNEKKRSME